MTRMLGVVMLGSLLRVCGRDASAPPTAQTVAVDVRLPAARHGGRVQRVGNYALETVAARSGGVALFWMDLQGNPIPPTQITLRTVRVEVNGRPRTVPARVVGEAWVARVDVPPSAEVVVTVPHVEVYAEPYDAVVVPSVVVVAALPGIIVVPAPAVVAPVLVIQRGKHRKFRGFRHGFRWR